MVLVLSIAIMLASAGSASSVLGATSSTGNERQFGCEIK
jgi:hypothetical protein